MVRLTTTVKTSGCAAKLAAGELDKILSSIPQQRADELIVGFETHDDALAWDLGDGRIMIQSVDFFPPVADEAYDFGQVAAANALSDIYAMGAVPAVAMNVMCFPSCMDLSIMKDILLGAQDKAREAGLIIAGGHTISDQGIKFGLCVTGFTTKDRLWKNRGAEDGDVIVVTKRIGTGIINTMIKAGEASAGAEAAVLASMKELNRRAAETAYSYHVHAATDITGFSLLGHLHEMAEASCLSIDLDCAAVPVFEEALEGARFGFIPEGAYNNRDYLADSVIFDPSIPLELRDLLFDPQTSGPLALAMSRDEAQDYVRTYGEPACIIGQFSSGDRGVIRVHQNNF